MTENSFSVELPHEGITKIRDWHVRIAELRRALLTKGQSSSRGIPDVFLVFPKNHPGS